MMPIRQLFIPAQACLLLGAVLLAACSTPETDERPAQPTVELAEERSPCTNANEFRQALFGDLHVHTSFSFDAAANATGGTPTDAYDFARGKPIPFFPIDAEGNPSGTIQIDRPLDFVAVTDHGEFLGERRLCRDPDSPRYDTEFCTQARVSERQGMRMFGAVITTETPRRIAEVCDESGELCREWARSPWEAMIEAAEMAYDRTPDCEFTSFIGYEYTGTPGTSNYHRNVIFRGSEVPDLPVSYVEAPLDSQLWQQLDQACPREEGCDYLTIPHNSNLANGRMAPYRGLDGSLESRRAYAEKRLEREPILEIFQHKGGSECINGLSSVFGEPDELCNVEAVRTMGVEKTFAITERDEQGRMVPGEMTQLIEECAEGEVGSSGMVGGGCVGRSDFARSALLEGLEEEIDTGLNPAKLGFIGSTDTHTATPGASRDEDWRGAVSVEATPEERLQPGLLTSGIDGNPGGLAGVWAVENSRDAIFDAMKRREVFGTSGTRIQPRFFAGWDYSSGMCDAVDMVEQAYASGVPMGGDLTSGSQGQKPTFIAFAARDSAPEAAQLQQLQLVKGWVDGDGQSHFDVTTIAGDADNGATVDLTTGERSGPGHDSLCAVYIDESFEPDQHAYYYLRVVENPSLRWSVYDCLRIPEGQRPAVCTDGSYPSTIQEMAWTSPVWYKP